MLFPYLNQINIYKKLYIYISKQLERLLQRVNQLSIAKPPSCFHMVMIKYDDTPMDLSEWDLL